MDISIIIPSYKPKDYLLECLHSIAKQTLSPERFEVIVILNGCYEPYFDNINNYISQAGIKQYIIIQTDEGGVSNARNIGIRESKGTYITFIDDDDVISENYLEELLKVSNETCVGCSNSFSFRNTTSELENNFLSEAYNKCLNKPFDYYLYRQFLSPPVCKLIHKSIIAQNLFPVNLNKSEDSVFCMRISNNIKQMKLASYDCIYYIRKREGSSSRKDKSLSRDLKDLLVIEIEYFKTWMRHPFSYNIKFVLSRFIAAFRNFIWYRKASKCF